MRKIVLIFVLWTGCFSILFGKPNQVLPFQVGTAKVDITPSSENFSGIVSSVRDHLFCRAIVIKNDMTSAALISIDHVMISDEFYEEAILLIGEETGIPFQNIIIAASHTHSGLKEDEISVSFVVDAVKQAKEKLQPASVSYGTGLSYININRDVIDQETGLWKQGPNYEGLSDKTVAVITFRSKLGKPIAIYYNYAMHANTMFMSGTLSADFPGETSKYIEEYYGNGVVALFSSGAAGDQNPISTVPMEEAVHAMTEALISNGKAKNFGEALMIGLFGRIKIDLDKIDPGILERQSQMVTSLGQILGEEVIRVTKMPQNIDSKISIYGANKIITCPGRKRLDIGREGAPGTYIDGDPIDIKLSVLRIGDIAIAGVNAEVYSAIGQAVKEGSPLMKTIFSSIANGSSKSGYIPNDDAFQRYTFQVLNSSLKPNFAERSIIDGLVEMIEKSSL
ncbi:MAG: neutral/alkaline non-lysosomal ceramidase N-terminal domain-containing protein [Labilibaculum sp.]|nr:neutral/alkaline non-lysosomal ceramidase N-terminal domain-containing protein [Labilibaculum sp.]